MTDDTLRLAICRNIAARAHLADAESMALREAGHCDAAATARRRYWRETAAVALLSGHRWPEAERLGGVA